MFGEASWPHRLGKQQAYLLFNFSFITHVSFLTKRSFDDFTVLSSPVAPRFCIWQLAVPPMTMGWRWDCRLDGLYFIMLGTFSAILLLYFFFSNWKQGIVGWTALSSPETPLVVMATTCDATGGVWGRWLCGLRFSFVFSARLTWHLHPIYRDSHVTEMHMILCILVLLILKNFAIIT